MDYGYAYSILFQLWIDEISKAEYFNELLDRHVYTRMVQAYARTNGGFCPPLPVFSILADDAFVILDVAAAIHCNDLGEFDNVDNKRKEMITMAQNGNPFCREPRRVELISGDLDLTFIMTMFNSFEDVGTDSSELHKFPIVGFDKDHTTLH